MTRHRLLYTLLLVFIRARHPKRLVLALRTAARRRYHIGSRDGRRSMPSLERMAVLGGGVSVTDFCNREANTL